MLSIMEAEPSRSVKVLTFVWARSRKAACNAVTWERRAPKSTALPAADNLWISESSPTSTPSISVLKLLSPVPFKSRPFSALASVLISAFNLLMGLLSMGRSIFLSCACNLAICALICFTVSPVSRAPVTLIWASRFCSFLISALICLSVFGISNPSTTDFPE